MYRCHLAPFCHRLRPQAWFEAVVLCALHSPLAAAELCTSALQMAHPHCLELWLQHLTMQSAEGVKQRVSVANDMTRHGLQPPPQ